TNAANQGLRVGDIILDANGTAISTPEDLRELLSKTKPDEMVKLTVQRAGITAPIILTTTLTEHPLDLVRLSSTGGADQIPANVDHLSSLLSIAAVGNRTIPVGKQEIPQLPSQHNSLWKRLDQTEGADDSDDSTAEIESDAGASSDPSPKIQSSAVYQLGLTAKQMEAVGGDQLVLTRTYDLQPGTYAFDVDVELKNTSSKKTQSVALRLQGVNGVTMEGWWYSYKTSPHMFDGAGARDIVYSNVANGQDLKSCRTILSHAKNNPKSPELVLTSVADPQPRRTINYIGVDAQYFNVSYLGREKTPLTGFPRSSAIMLSDSETVPKYKERAANPSFFIETDSQNLAPGESLKRSLTVFAGPKNETILAPYGLASTIEYGWFGPISRTLQPVLHFLHDRVTFGSYTLAIIMLTLGVRMLMFPFSRKAAVQAQRMQKLAPKLAEVKEKYEGDLEGQMRAQRELQREAGLNPLAGCLPMLAQMPIFIGLYRSLCVDVELRQQPLISGVDWASNLAGPDKVFFWESYVIEFLGGRGTGWLGPYLNMLPLIVLVLFITQQKIFMPKATTDEARTQQRMMMFMTFFMAVLFFKVPAGLCVYFITSSLWGICERLIVRRTLPKDESEESATSSNAAKESSTKKNADEDAKPRPVTRSKKKPKSSQSDLSSLAESIIDRFSDNEPEPETRPANRRKRPQGKKKKKR
ncbi:MAG: YidC/Oxa1 family insertase periplasmic-domain containing protein, partial [Planctomycetota bacterium]